MIAGQKSDHEILQEDNVPKVSVCIPSYNYANHIAGCIESVLAQTFKDWELVVVDNCSSDNTVDVVRSFHDKRIRFYVNQTNLGLTRNWNRCVSLARGGYVAILPADDMYLPRMLERSVATLDAQPQVAFTHSALMRIDDHGSMVDTVRLRDTDIIMNSEAALRFLLMGCDVSPPTVVMRRSCFEEAGGFDETLSYSIDWGMWLQMALSHDVAYIAEPLARNRYQHSGSMTARRVFRRPRIATSEEVQILGEIFARLPRTTEWKKIQHEAHLELIGRHLDRTLRLLRQGATESFRSEIAYALGLDLAFPLKYRKMTALWFASLLGAGFANWLDRSEQRFWFLFRGGQPSSGTP